jgi:hypothetical protein
MLNFTNTLTAVNGVRPSILCVRFLLAGQPRLHHHQVDEPRVQGHGGQGQHHHVTQTDHTGTMNNFHQNIEHILQEVGGGWKEGETGRGGEECYAVNRPSSHKNKL